MQILSSLFPFIVFLVDLIIMVACLRKISTQIYFNYFNRMVWMFIVVFGSFLGQLMYFLMESNENSK
jgi:hypothetical protein